MTKDKRDEALRQIELLNEPGYYHHPNCRKAGPAELPPRTRKEAEPCCGTAALLVAVKIARDARLK